MVPIIIKPSGFRLLFVKKLLSWWAVDSSRHLTTDNECRSGNNRRKDTEDGKESGRRKRM
jgi:hypothetical protein